MPERVPVTVIGGYLGAGKTTLVNHLLRSADARVAVLVNDFGAVDIDSELIESADEDTITLANGCICCSLADGFGAALDRVRALPRPPERLLIEASGVADPGTVAAYAHAPGFRLDGVIVLVDAERIRRQIGDELVGDTVVRQIAAADLVVCNKIDLVDAGELPGVHGAIASLSPAPILDATSADVPTTVLLGPIDRVSSAPTGEPIPAADVFCTWTRSFDEPLDRRDLVDWLDALSPKTVRVKGFVRFADDPETLQLVQRVGARTSITPAGTSSGRPTHLVGIDLDDRGPTDGS